MLKIIIFAVAIIFIVLIICNAVVSNIVDKIYNETIKDYPNCLVCKATNVRGLEKSKDIDSFLPRTIILSTTDSYKFLDGYNKKMTSWYSISKRILSSLTIDKNYKINERKFNALVFKVSGKDDIVFCANKNSQLLIDDYNKYKQSIEMSNN